jgi:hypothetical protein
MPVKRRMAKHNALTDDNRQALLYGPETVLLSTFGHYYRTGSAHIKDEPPEAHAKAEAMMRADWNRHGVDLLAEWTEPFPPWAQTRFGQPADAG